MPPWLRINSFYRTKLSEAEQPQKGKHELGVERQHGHATTTTRGHRKHHEQPVVVAVPGALRFASLLRRLLFLARGIRYGVFVLGHFGPS